MGESRSPKNSHEKQPQTHRVPLKPKKNATFESGFKLMIFGVLKRFFHGQFMSILKPTNLGKRGIIDKHVS